MKRRGIETPAVPDRLPGEGFTKGEDRDDGQEKQDQGDFLVLGTRLITHALDPFLI